MRFRLINESLKPRHAYMLRSDGELLECGNMHPYIKYVVSDTFDTSVDRLFNNKYANYDFLYWFYTNTKSTVLRNDICLFISTVVKFNIVQLSEQYLQKFDINYEDIVNDINELQILFESINDKTNNEFTRVRTSNMKFGGHDNSIYFRISSIGFNWFSLIWELVYENRNFITNVTICNDTQTDGKELHYYKHGNEIIFHMDVDDFINLSGNPIIEKFNTIHEETMNPYSYHIVFTDLKEQYINNNFVEVHNEKG